MVYDQKRKAIENAQVFLASSALGAYTRGSGMFRIKNVPPGTYDLIVYKEGYGLRQFPVTVDTSRRNDFNFRLKSKPPKTATTAGSAQNTKDHEKKVKKFREGFFSTTSNSYESKIMNPEVLEFPEDKSTTFKAVAQEPLVFENKAIGHKVTYFLKEFEITNNFTKYHGISRFEELTPVSSEEAHKWRLNRLKAFRGSPTHFFASLYENYATQAKDNAVLKSEGFIVSMMLDRQHEGDEAYSLPTASRSKSKPIDVNNYITRGDNGAEFQLSFRQFWEITYTNELQEPEYLWHQGLDPNTRQRYKRVNRTALSDYKGETYSGNLGDQKSLIKLTSESLTISTANNYNYDFLGVQVFDYWSWQGMAEILPKGYTLDVARSEAAVLAKYLNKEN
ncbi:carboxypeptidase regulatory-like domain-containing protein, partial [candidate division KSB1 bacterium]|nr:carboxypeptidase regulatory-like domain-containing protein [candidate division KSB1 bacterium]